MPRLAQLENDSERVAHDQVIAKLKTLGMSGDGIEVAVQVLMGYVDAKRRKGRSEEGVVRRLEALQRAVSRVPSYSGPPSRLEPKKGEQELTHT